MGSDVTFHFLETEKDTERQGVEDIRTSLSEFYAGEIWVNPFVA